MTKEEIVQELRSIIFDYQKTMTKTQMTRLPKITAIGLDILFLP